MLPPDSRTTLLKQIARLRDPPSSLVGDNLHAGLGKCAPPMSRSSVARNTGSADVVETVAAIKASIGNVDIFHQAGQISVLRDRGPLFSLLEPSVHGIHRAQGLFHPKLWLGSTATRMARRQCACSSSAETRTKDRSWDVALLVRRKDRSNAESGQRPLEHLLTYLGSASVTPIAEHRQRRLAELGKRLQKVEELPRWCRGPRVPRTDCRDAHCQP